jgi:hypothetical protein
VLMAMETNEIAEFMLYGLLPHDVREFEAMYRSSIGSIATEYGFPLGTETTAADIPRLHEMHLRAAQHSIDIITVSPQFSSYSNTLEEAYGYAQPEHSLVFSQARPDANTGQDGIMRIFFGLPGFDRVVTEISVDGEEKIHTHGMVCNQVLKNTARPYGVGILKDARRVGGIVAVEFGILKNFFQQACSEANKLSNGRVSSTLPCVSTKNRKRLTSQKAPHNALQHQSAPSQQSSYQKSVDKPPGASRYGDSLVDGKRKFSGSQQYGSSTRPRATLSSIHPSLRDTMQELDDESMSRYQQDAESDKQSSSLNYLYHMRREVENIEAEDEGYSTAAEDEEDRASSIQQRQEATDYAVAQQEQRNDDYSYVCAVLAASTPKEAEKIEKDFLRRSLATTMDARNVQAPQQLQRHSSQYPQYAQSSDRRLTEYPSSGRRVQFEPSPEAISRNSKLCCFRHLLGVCVKGKDERPCTFSHDPVLGASVLREMNEIAQQREKGKHASPKPPSAPPEQRSGPTARTPTVSAAQREQTHEDGVNSAGRTNDSDLEQQL